MLIGVPKEIKNHEYRVGLVPSSVRELVHNGHQVIVETNAGGGIGFTDSDYEAAGASIVTTAAEIFAKSEMVVKVKEPQEVEYKQLREGQLLFTYLHLAPDAPQTHGLLESGCVAVAYETVTDTKGTQYIFGGNGNYIFTDNSTLVSYDDDKLRQASYYLSKIITVNGEIIEYSYTSYQYIRDYLKNETRSIFNGGVINLPDYSGTSKVYGMLIKEITFPNGKIKLKKSTSVRSDLKNTSTSLPYAIEHIELYDTYDNKVKTWKFNYAYFGSISNNLTCRLKLNSLVINGEDNSTQGDYIFSYDNTPLPSKSGYGIDHWGYPNGFSNTT